jgi:type IV pilus assembly protein PilE
MKKLNAGVTLMELLTVIVVISILASIAMPGYRQYMIRAHRADAKVALNSTASALERCFTRFTAYNSADCPTAAGLPVTVEAATYRIEFSGTPTATAYVLQAVPLGAQAKDTECANFRLDQAGARTVTGTSSATPATCWNR